jgi:hypothetical protein
MEPMQIIERLSKLSLDIEILTDTLQAYVSLFYGEDIDRPTDRAIGNGLWGLAERLTATAEEIDRINDEVRAAQYRRNELDGNEEEGKEERPFT